MAKEMIFSSAKKTVYRDGDTAIKEFCEGFPKAEVLNEALCNARVETIEALNVPKVLGVTVTDGKWSIIKEYVPGKTLEQLMGENPGRSSAADPQPGLPAAQQTERKNHPFLKIRGTAGRRHTL